MFLLWTLQVMEVLAMTENSLATAVLEDIPVIVFLLNNFHTWEW